MRTIGIDYGLRRVGVAISDESGSFALPVSVAHPKKLIEELKELQEKDGFSLIVLGESKDYSGKDNSVMTQIKKFKKEAEKELEIEVVYEPEFLTSAAAERIQGKTDMHDASAAALILQSYLDKQKNKHD